MTNEEIQAIRQQYKYDPTTLKTGMEAPTTSVDARLAKFRGQEVEVPQEKTLGQKAIGVAGEIVKPFERLGQGVLNATAGNIVGKQSQAKGLFGNQFDTLGYRDGQALQGGEMVKDVVGNALDVGSYAVPVGTGAKVLTKIGKGVKAGAIAGALTGTGQALQEGQTTPEAIGQGAVYGVGGAALGGAIPGVVSGAKAVYNKLNPSEKFIESQIVKQFTKGVKPILPGKTTPSLLSKYNDNVVIAIKTIKANQEGLNFTDEVGEVLTGQTPKSINQLNDAVEQTKKTIFTQYDALTKTAGESGMVVDVTPISNELDVIIGNKALAVTNPNAVQYAQNLKERLVNIGKLDAQTAQEVVQNYNKSLEAFYRNPTYDNASNAAIDSVVANNVRKALDDGISGITGKQYQALKNQYGALKAIERDVIKASLKEARKNVKGLIDFTDIFSGGQVVSGIISLNPAMVASGVTQKAIAATYKFLNDPNRAISKMFEAVDIPVGGVVKPISDAVKGTVGDFINETKKNSKLNAGFVAIPGEAKKKVEIPTYKGETDLTTKLLKDLEGKSTVSKQYILDATNRGELKQVERDLFRKLVEDEGNTIDVAKFANKVKAELLPLKVKNSLSSQKAQDIVVNDPYKAISEGKKVYGVTMHPMDESISKTSRPLTLKDYENKSFEYFVTTKQPDFVARYESVSLPDELRGNVKNYNERVYESPIKTSAGETHFGGSGNDNYFGHTRIEDMADNQTRRVIEVQSDLTQKGGLDKEVFVKNPRTPEEIAKARIDLKSRGQTDNQIENLLRLDVEGNKRMREVAKLRQYDNNAAHFRMIREEIKKAAEDGKTKLQFPTGETAMKIEGLGTQNNWDIISEKFSNGMERSTKLDIENLKVGAEIKDGNVNRWIITDVLGEGKFKAVPKDVMDNLNSKDVVKVNGLADNISTQIGRENFWKRHGSMPEDYFKKEIARKTEEFDISGKVDTNNPIYKFYNKEVRNYLNKFGGKEVVDDKGVSWIEIPVTKGSKGAVEAFGLLGAVGLGAMATGSGKAEASTFVENKNTEELKTIDKAISTVYAQSEKLAPRINKKYIKALVAQESTNGTNERHRQGDAGKYGWLVGFTKPTYEGIVEQAKTQQKYKNLLAQINLDTPENALKSALAYSTFLLRDHTAEQKQTGNEKMYTKMLAGELYAKYNGEESPEGIKNFIKLFNSMPNN